MTKIVTIIGGGAVGCAIAYELSQKQGLEIYVLEKNNKINGDNQTSRNSGVIHAGIYYPKSTEPLKAKFCVEGNRLLYDFCKEHNVPHKRTGKLVVATNPLEEEYLDDVLNTAINNGITDAKKITGEEARRMEKNIKSTTAAYFPSTGIIEPTVYVLTLKRLAENNGVYFAPGNKVLDIKKKNKFKIIAECNNNSDIFEADIVINSAGVYSDEIAKLINSDSPYVMDPVRGEAAQFYRKKSDLFMNGMNVYPAPYGFFKDTGKKAEVSFSEYNKLLDEKKVTRTVGVHLTPTFDIVNDEYVIGNTITIGPTSTINIGKEDYGTGLHPVEHYLNKVTGFFPNLKLEDIQLYQSGIRAKLKDQNDFVIEKDRKNPNFINLIGIDSPGLTSSLAIAKYVSDIMKD